MEKNRVVSGLFWRFAERCGAQGVAFIVSIILARILEPNVYGTVALVTVFTTIMQVFVDSGLGNSLIQKKEVDDLDFSTVFYCNVIICTILYFIMYIISPYIANFYNDSSLIPVIRVLSITILISGIKNVQQAYVSKNMLFKKFFFSTLIGTIGAAIIGIIMAYLGFGVWALVAQQVFNACVDTFVLWITVKWRPKRMFSFTRLKELYSYGWKLLVSSLIDTIYTNICQLIIGKKYSSAELSYYNRGKQFPNFIVTNVNTSIDSVLFPTLSNVQDNIDRVKNMTRKSIKVSTYVMAPLMMGLVFSATNVIEFLLTDKWIECVPILRIFCITYMFYPIHTANLNAIKALGRSDLFLKLEITKKTIGILFVLITMQFGIFAMALGMLFSSVAGQIINSWPNKKLLNYSYLNQLKDIIPSIILAVFMGICILPINILNITLLGKIILQIIFGGTIYIVGSKLIKIDAFDYIFDIVKNIKKSI